ncbi:MAG: Lipase 1 precursor [Candidatus Heimdallarchaeota archaeon LC_2]|nr:MAG: Lipase 1 precursor [Candidatus Heimdallarchaeota archaeon LC_2]
MFNTLVIKMSNMNIDNLEIKTLKVKYGKMSYYSHKAIKSTTVLFIHGSGAGKEWFQEHFLQRPIKEYSWLVPSLFGYDKKEKPNILDAYTMEQFAQDLYELLLQEQVLDLIIMGHSMGGKIGVLLSEIISSQQDVHPIKVRGLYNCEGPLTLSELTVEDIEIANSSHEAYEMEYNKQLAELEAKNDEASKRGVQSYMLLGSFLIWAVFRNFKLLLEKETLNQRMRATQKKLGHANYYIVGDQNYNKLPTQKFYENHEILIIPNAGHIMMQDNPQGFWDRCIQSFNQLSSKIE